MEIYLDNAATTRCEEDVARLMQTIYTEDYGNPSSAHRKGFAAECILREASERIAKTLRCKRTEIVFTSGGTEADNLALRGAAAAAKRRGSKIITTAIEHPAVYECARTLREEGYEVVFLPVDHNGVISFSALEEALDEETVLVSVMAVGNETGVIEPLEKIGRLIKEKNPATLFHTDAVQAYGKVPLSLQAAKIDLLSASAHKIGGPKGCGFLYVREGVRLKPLLHGGGQQQGVRSGTENVPGIAGCGLAAQIAFSHLTETADRLHMLRVYFCGEVTRRIPAVSVNGMPSEEAGEQFAPHIVSLSVRGVRAEVLLHALEDEGIYISAGSACASHRQEVSRTLQAIGLEEELLTSTVRLSFSAHTTKEELDHTIGVMERMIPKLRRYKAE